MEKPRVSDVSASKAELDSGSVQINDEHVMANLVVEGHFQKQFVFGVIWKRGHELDWSWQGLEGWLQTEFNAEQSGIEAAHLLGLAEMAIKDFAKDMGKEHPDNQVSL
jgi:hypothetical protein